MHLTEYVNNSFHTNKMEIQTTMLHHNPYDIVKSEQPSTPPKQVIKSPYIDNSPDMVFGNFQIHQNFCAPANNNTDPLNNNHTKVNSNGRVLAADRKRPYPCNLCPSKFGSKMELEEHQNSHTGMKPFECDVCKARFNRRSTLWNHKRIHSDAKPFVCTVCQMTFKWKNSLKCHKDMHQRKNETSAHLDNDLRQLTYATAAKRKLLMEQEENGGSPATSTSSSIHSHPLITTTTPKKKSQKLKNLKQSQNNNQSSNLNNVHLNSVQPLQASALIPPSDHQLDLDTSSLDTLMHNQSQNILMQLYGDVDGPLASRHGNGMLSGLDDANMLDSSKNDNSSGQLNMQLPMQINMLNFRQLNTQQLPSVHHLTSTSLPSVSSNIDYGLPHESNQQGIPHQQYIVTTQPDMMIPQQSIGYQQPIDNCVILATGQDYVPNFDYSMLNQQYQMGIPDVNDQRQQQQQQQPQQQQNQSQPRQQQQQQQPAQSSQQAHNQQSSLNDGKVLPYEQW